MKTLAQIQLAPDGGFKGFGKLGLQGTSATNADITFAGFISGVIGILTVVAIIWAIFIFISGAISYMASGGDKAAVESARKRIANGLIGLVLVILSLVVIKLLGYLLGMPDILNFVSLFSMISGN